MSENARPTPEALAAAEALLRDKETNPVRSTLLASGAYLEKWLEGQGLSPGEHAEIMALRTVLADREARLADAEAALAARAWAPVCDGHRDGRWLFVMHRDLPGDECVARWLDRPHKQWPWEVRGSDTFLQEDAVTHCADLPGPLPADVEKQRALALSYPKRVFHSVEDEGFIAVAPDLPGSSAFGQTEAEAIAELNQAIPAWISACRKAGNPVPPPSRYDAR